MQCESYKDWIVADRLFPSSNAQGKSFYIHGMGELALKILMNGKKVEELMKPLRVSASVKDNTKLLLQVVTMQKDK